jgi:hypothetical protein
MNYVAEKLYQDLFLAELKNDYRYQIVLFKLNSLVELKWVLSKDHWIFQIILCFI